VGPKKISKMLVAMQVSNFGLHGHWMIKSECKWFSFFKC